MHGKRILHRIGFARLGILVVVFFWFIEALLHSFVFGSDSFVNNLLSHDANELWMRLLISIVVIGFGFYAQHTFLQHQKMQTEIRKKSARLLEIIDCSYDAYISIDESGAIREWNRSAEVLFGWSRHEIVGKNITNIIPERLREAQQRGMNHYQHHNIGPWLYKPIHTRALHRNGFEISIEMVITPLKSDGIREFFAFIRKQDN